MIEQTVRSSFSAAASAVKERSEEINRLNVFPVPDGDTGTNMALTLATVVGELSHLPADAPVAKVPAATRALSRARSCAVWRRGWPRPRRPCPPRMWRPCSGAP